MKKIIQYAITVEMEDGLVHLKSAMMVILLILMDANKIVQFKTDGHV